MNRALNFLWEDTGLLFLLDSAAKGSLLLALAAVAVVCLRRDSAATRHLVWLLAIVALLATPLLSASLPQWRILPGWTKLATAELAPKSSPPVVTEVVPAATIVSESTVDISSGIAFQPIEEPGEILPTAIAPANTPTATAATTNTPWNWPQLLTFGWMIGVSALLVRLVAARWLLWQTERQATVVVQGDPLADALRAAQSQIGTTTSVTLLVHPGPAIPVVWGLLRARLLLPAAARDWKSAQLHSVLLHELAHLQRRDTWAQLLAQITCALHWFNPLVWLANWQLSVERERACDDLVLASGVRPSAYAGHLLEVATSFAPARWTQACGLAMARQSSLEGRLIAVLSKQPNRRTVSRVLAAVALVLAAGIAIPVAMLAAMEQAAATNPPSTATALQPKHEYAQSLFRKWKSYARTDGKIPGALIGHFAKEVDSFLKQYPQDEISPKLAAIRPMLDSSRDWPQADVVAILDEITAISTAPVSWADTPLEFDEMRSIKPGQPLPDSLKNIDWGKPASNGLRAAWLLDPRQEKYPLGSVLKARVLIHNRGKDIVIFNTETWHQYDGHNAVDANDKSINISGAIYTGITPMAKFRLAPGEYCEVLGHGMAVGGGTYEEEFSLGKVGAIIEAKQGDEVRLSHTVDLAQGGWTKPDDPKDATGLWKKSIADRVSREAPLPKATADREQLIRRVALDIFGVAATAEEVAAFTKDDTADALTKLTERLQARPRPEVFSGKLPTGETRFQVIAADPDAKKKPATASSPGRYILKEGVHLLVRQVTENSVRSNKAVIAFLSPDPKVASPHKPYEIELPDGLQTWGAVWQREANEIWIMQKGIVRKYDFQNPDEVKETRFSPGTIQDVPETLRAALQVVFQAPGAPVQQQNSQKPNEGAKLDPAVEQRLKWGEAVKGLRAAIAIRSVEGEGTPEEKFRLDLVVQNVSTGPIRLCDQKAGPNSRSLSIKKEKRTLAVLAFKDPTNTDQVLQPREVARLYVMSPDDERSRGRNMGSVIADGLLQDPQQRLLVEFNVNAAPGGAWFGKLVTGETTGLAAAGEPQPQTKEGQALYQALKANARKNRDIPGGLIALLGDKVKEFVKNNEKDTFGAPYAKKMQPLLSRFGEVRDLSAADTVTLLDDIAAANDIPLETTLEKIGRDTFRAGTPLPKELASAPWGEAQANGLRMAWLLDPRAAEYRLNTPLKSRILLHNSGKNTIVLQSRSWHQFSDHQAKDAKRGELPVESTYWTTLSSLGPYRLAPGEFVELIGAGIGVGKNREFEDWQGTRVGAWIDAQAGDDVTFLPAKVPLHDWNDEAGLAGKPDWWLQFVKERLSRELPLPADAVERTAVLGRVTRDLFGNAPTADEAAAFVADMKPDAIDSLATRLANRAGYSPFAGDVAAGSTQFRVLPVDPDAAKRPRTANNPGRYTLSDLVRLQVSRRGGERIVNEATISFYAADSKDPPPGKPVDLKLPDGYGTWAAAWHRSKTILWVQQASGIRSYDFSNPADVKQVDIAPEEVEKVPEDIRAAMRPLLQGLPGAAPATAAPK